MPSSTSSISVAVDQYILPLDKPFVQVYPHANNLLPVRYPATLNAYISNEPGYYVDGLFLIQGALRCVMLLHNAHRCVPRHSPSSSGF